MDSTHHILEEYVTELRKTGRDVPDFEPRNGDTRAKVLFLLEAPGPMASGERGGSGLISQYNNDPTARRTKRFIESSLLNQKDLVLWNIVPWYIGNAKKIRHPNSIDLNEGIQALAKLLSLMRDLQAIVLFGQHAQRTASDIQLHTNVRIFYSPHPSPQARIENPTEVDVKIERALSLVYDRLNQRLF